MASGKPIPGAMEFEGRPYMDLKQCGDYPYILLKKGHGVRTAIEVMFLEHGVRPKNIFETTSNETAYRLATVDMGITIVPKTTVILSNAIRKPYLYSLSKEGVYWEIGAIYRQKEFLTEAQRDLQDIMKRHFSSGVS